MFEKQCNFFLTPEVDMEGIPSGGEVEEEEEGGSSEDSMDAVTLHIQVQAPFLLLRNICCLD